MDDAETGKNACPTEAGEFAHLVAGLAGRCGAETLQAATGDRVIGIELERAIEVFPGFFYSTLRRQVDTQVRMGVGVAGILIQRAAEQLLGFSTPTGSSVGNREIVHGADVLVGLCQRRLVMVDGLVQPAL